MRAARALLIALGVGLAAYGGSLLHPQVGTALPWLISGPLLYDLAVAPLVGLVGLALGRLLPDRTTRSWLIAGLTATATLLLIAVPLLWRPAPAPANPGLQDRDYLLQLTVWLAALWVGLAVSYRIWRGRRGTGREHGIGPAGRTPPPPTPPGPPAGSA